jgi:hypothetical protein
MWSGACRRAARGGTGAEGPGRLGGAGVGGRWRAWAGVVVRALVAKGIEGVNVVGAANAALSSVGVGGASRGAPAVSAGEIATKVFGVA